MSHELIIHCNYSIYLCSMNYTKWYNTLLLISCRQEKVVAWGIIFYFVQRKTHIHPCLCLVGLHGCKLDLQVFQTEWNIRNYICLYNVIQTINSHCSQQFFAEVKTAGTRKLLFCNKTIKLKNISFF